MSSRFFQNKDYEYNNRLRNIHASSSIPLTSQLLNEKEEALVSASTSNLGSAATSSSSVKSKHNKDPNLSNYNVVSANPLRFEMKNNKALTSNYLNNMNLANPSQFYMNNDNYYQNFCFANPALYYANSYVHPIQSFYPQNLHVLNNNTIQPNFVIQNQYVNSIPNMSNHYTLLQYDITSSVPNSFKIIQPQTCEIIFRSQEECFTGKPILTNEQNITYENVEEFINSCKNIVSYVDTLKGSRHIQKLLVKEEDKAFTVYLFIKKDLDYLLTNVYGNYVCKKIFSLLKKKQRQIVWEYLMQDIRKYCEHQHANHCIQMLITQSECDSEKEAIEKRLSHLYKYLSSNEHGINVLFAIIAIVNYENKDVLIIKFIIDNLLDLARDSNANILCSAIVTKLSSENCAKLHKQNFLKKLKPLFYDLVVNEYSSSLIVQILEEWGLEDCEFFINILFQNFINYALNPFSSLVIQKIILMLEICVSQRINV